MRSNKYPGVCTCGKKVDAYRGYLYKGNGGRWVVQCPECADRNDHSSFEDRCCGDAAYEDACARACGF